MNSSAQPVEHNLAAPAECLYVYGIVDSAIHPCLLVGASRGAGLQLTKAGRVAAVHCWIDPATLEDLEPDIAEGSRLADLVRRHDDVVMALAIAGPVLPVRLGTLVADAHALRQALNSCEEELAAALDRVRGRAEWDLRVTPPTVHAAAHDAAEQSLAGAAVTGHGTAYLQARRDARRQVNELRTSLSEAIGQLDACLAECADDSNGRAFAAGAGSMSRAYLVADSMQDRFVAAAREGIAELERLGCSAVLRGPLPPYSFADVRLGGESP